MAGTGHHDDYANAAAIAIVIAAQPSGCILEPEELDDWQWEREPSVQPVSDPAMVSQPGAVPAVRFRRPSIPGRF